MCVGGSLYSRSDAASRGTASIYSDGAVCSRTPIFPSHCGRSRKSSLSAIWDDTCQAAKPGRWALSDSWRRSRIYLRLNLPPARCRQLAPARRHWRRRGRHRAIRDGGCNSRPTYGMAGASSCWPSGHTLRPNDHRTHPSSQSGPYTARPRYRDGHDRDDVGAHLDIGR